MHKANLMLGFGFSRLALIVLAAGLILDHRASPAQACPERDAILKFLADHTELAADRREPGIDSAEWALDGDDDKGDGKKGKHKSGTPSKAKAEGSGKKIMWGRRPNETAEKYEKRYNRVLKKVKMDKEGNFDGGPTRLHTYMGHPFIVRSDISPEFTADTAMYMEMLHREYGTAYKKFLGVPADVHAPVEVIVFSEQSTYMQNGGAPGSGGFFMSFAHLKGDRGEFWPARHFRLQQFTDGIKDFAKWEKGTLKHEAAHMELQLRLGMKSDPRYGGIGLPIDCPRWFNEGHATVFEYWDFDKTVDENLAAAADRGRYAPVIRRIIGTKKWKDFKYVWTIDPQSWGRDMTSEQGFLNYAQAWSLCAYMMTSGIEGRKDFRAVYDLSKRVGSDRQTTYKGDRTVAWEEKFPEEDREALEKHWVAWTKENVRRDEKVPDEDYFLKRMGYNPKITKTLKRFEEDEAKKNREWVQKEEKRREKSKKIEK